MASYVPFLIPYAIGIILKKTSLSLPTAVVASSPYSLESNYLSNAFFLSDFNVLWRLDIGPDENYSAAPQQTTTHLRTSLKIDTQFGNIPSNSNTVSFPASSSICSTSLNLQFHPTGPACTSDTTRRNKMIVE